MGFDFKDEGVVEQATATPAQAQRQAREPFRHRPVNSERFEAGPGPGVDTRASAIPPTRGMEASATNSVAIEGGPLQKRFQRVNDMNMKYVVVDGYLGLPHDMRASKKTLMILFEAATNAIAGRPMTQAELHTMDGKDRQMVALLGLTRSTSPNGQTYELREAGFAREVLLIPKGAGFWPDLFERRMLNSRMAYGGCVPVPDADCRSLALLHYKLHRTDWGSDDPDLKETLVEWIDGKVGAAQTCDIKGYEIRWPSRQG